MKKMLMTLICLILLCGFSFGQKDLDVIHFKNGAVVKGRIIENVINNYVKIELLDGSVVAYSYSDIDKITKEATTPSPQRKVSSGTNQQKQMLYETQKKNPGTAVVFSCLLTSAGHAYAGNWGRGLLFSAARIGCGVLAVTAGIEETEPDYYGYTETEITSTYYIAMSGALIFAIWEMFDAHSEAERYNRKLYNRLHSKQPGFGLNIIPAKKGAKLALSYAF